MKIVAVGGGSGGHVTPVLAVISELKKFDPNLEVYFITDARFGRVASVIMQKAPLEVKVRRIWAGKFRRYNGVHWFKQLTHLPTTFANLRDIFLTGFGLLQSLWLLAVIRPDVVFAKGGFVCLPVGLAAHWLRIPLVLHDSDAHPGLTNRMLAKYAMTIATGSPVDNYNYPKNKTRYVGIPVDESFHPVSQATQNSFKASLGFKDTTKPLLVVTGGGLGARNINKTITAIAGQILPKVNIFHVSGERTYEETKADAPRSPGYILKPFISSSMAAVFGAADIVISRAGATAMQELASMAKAVILVPNPLLTGGHQLKNAAVFERQGAVLVADEQQMIVNPQYLKKLINKLLSNSQLRSDMAKRLHQLACPDAAVDMAGLIAEAAAAHTYQKKSPS